MRLEVVLDLDEPGVAVRSIGGADAIEWERMTHLSVAATGGEERDAVLGLIYGLDHAVQKVRAAALVFRSSGDVDHRVTRDRAEQHRDTADLGCEHRKHLWSK